MTKPPVPRQDGRFSALVAWIETYPCCAFAAFAFLHAAIWTILPAVLYPNLPLDIIEALVYGREWQLGHDKLPPLPWWLVEIAHRLARFDFGLYLLAQIVVLSALALVFLTALPLTGAAGALAAVLIADGLHYFNFTAVKFNHDVMQLPFWALAGFSFHRALTRGRLVYWALLGLALGGALWAKYFVVVLAASLGLFLLIDARARRSLLTPGPYVAAAVALAVAAPHLVWLVQNDFLPFRYAEARASAARGALGHIVYPLFFAGAQLAWMLPSAFVASPLFFPRSGRQHEAYDGWSLRIVALLAFGPAAILIAGSAITGRGLITMWGYPLWLFAGLWVVMFARTAITRERFGKMIAGWGIVTAIYAAVFAIQYAVLPHFDTRYRASLFPGHVFAERTVAGFRAATGASPAYVVAPMWLGGNISYYAPGARPRVLIDARPERAPWIDLDDLRRRGAIVAWMDSDPKALPDAYAAVAKGAEIQPPLTAPLRWKKGDFTIGWAILKPQP